MTHPPVLISKPSKNKSIDTPYYGIYTADFTDVRPRFLANTPYRKTGVGVSQFEYLGPNGRSYQVYKNSLPLWPEATNNGNPGQVWWAPMYNRVYANFLNKMKGGQDAQVGTALAEYGKTADFVKDKVSLISEFTQSYTSDPGYEKARTKMLKRKLKEAESGKYKVPDSVRNRWAWLLRKQRWSGPSQLGKLWLEYWMVVAPTIGDVHTALQVLSRDIPFGRVKSGTHNTDLVPNTSLNAIVGYKDTRIFRKMSLSAEVRLKNKNLALAQSLGLLNPLLIVGQTTPWSWMLGWFINWEQVLSSWTDFAGYDVRNACLSVRCSGTSRVWSQSGGWLNACLATQYVELYARQNPNVIPPPTLLLSVPGRLSITRALTSMSLVITTLSGWK